MGRTATLTFAREGASVVGCDVTVAPAEETVAMVHAAGGTMVSLQPCHLGDPSESAKPVDLAVSEFGRIDVLYNPRRRFASLHGPRPRGGASRRHRSTA